MSLTLNPSSGGEKLATHVAAGEHHQVIKMATGGADEAFPVSVANPLPTQHAPPPFWRVGFAESGAGLQGLAAAEMTLIQTGPGMTVNQTGGNLVITTGTTVNSETVLRSNLAFNGALLARYKAILSQRISNQTFRFELADLIGTGLAYTINSATSVTVTFPTTNPFAANSVGQFVRLSTITGAAGIPGRYAIASVSGLTVTFTVAGWPASGSGTLTLYGHNWLASEYSGASATSSSFDCQRRGWASGNTTATINTTAGTGHIGQIAFDVLAASYSDALVASNTVYQWSNRATRLENIPDEDVSLHFFMVVQNGSTAPTSSTTLTVGFLQAEDQGRNKVRITSSDPVGSHPQPVQIMGGTTAVTGTILPVTPTTTFTNSLATTNALLIKSTAATLWSAVVSNTSAAARFLKFFNLTVAPTVGTSVPVFTVPIPPGGMVLVNGGSNGIRFGAGISLAITGAAGDLDTTAIGAGDVKVATTFA